MHAVALAGPFVLLEILDSPFSPFLAWRFPFVRRKAMRPFFVFSGCVGDVIRLLFSCLGHVGRALLVFAVIYIWVVVIEAGPERPRPLHVATHSVSDNR